MAPQLSLFKLVLCGPSDVQQELELARAVIDNWNLCHGETEGFWVQHKNWSTDTYPALGERPQAEINRQIIDDSNAVVAIFWSRFGTPTGSANSGTEEEIRRGIQKGKTVMVYFSDLMPLPSNADAGQLDRLEQFRQELYNLGLCGSFNSRTQFQKKFATDLALMLNSFKAAPRKTARKPSTRVKQTAKGNNNIQVGGNVENLTVNQTPPKVKKIIERRPGSISGEEALCIREWIMALAEGEIKMTRRAAFSMWWTRFYKRFKIDKYESLLSTRMSEVESWYRQQSAIQKRGLKTTAPDLWQSERIRAIKAAMARMGVEKEAYYPDVAQRLKIKPFASLKMLTKRALEAVYRMALRDQKKL